MTTGQPARWRARCAIRVRQLAVDRSAHLQLSASFTSKAVSMLTGHQPAARELVAAVTDEGTPAREHGRGCCRVSTRSQRGARRRRRAGGARWCGAERRGTCLGGGGETSSEDLEENAVVEDKQRKRLVYRTPGMGFKTRPSSYLVDMAPTGRAHCRKCKRRVEKGEVRIVIRAFVRPSRTTSLVRCERCIDWPLVRVILSVYGHTARVPVDSRVSVEDASRLRARLRSEGDGHK